MNCGEVKNLLDPWLDRETDGEKSRAFEEHLGGCSPCREMVEGEKALRELLRDRLRDSAPSELVERVRAKIVHPPSFWRRNLSTAAAATLLVGLVGLIIFSHPIPVTAQTVAREALQQHERPLEDLHDSDTALCASSCCTEEPRKKLAEFFRKRLPFSPCLHDLSHLGYRARHGEVWEVRPGKVVSWTSHQSEESGGVVSHASLSGMNIAHGGERIDAGGERCHLYRKGEREVVLIFPGDSGVSCLFVFRSLDEAKRFLSSR